MSVINWGEVYYIVLREQGKQAAELYLKAIDRYPIEILDADKEITLEASKIKSAHKLSYADAFAAGLTKLKKAKLITGTKSLNHSAKR
ncbi:MAG: type II toxin-antitoxin system VapC family toxin [Melioribacteraceae bacterium]|nr:type II toxin-antitoxin system VapC family toxin [Melioribacteraceae bacterium]